jgi:hypothetical protein
MALFTFYVEKNRATIIEQFDGLDLVEAVKQWYERSGVTPGPQDPDEELTPVTGMRNVWCFGGINTEDEIFLVHVTGPLKE